MVKIGIHASKMSMERSLGTFVLLRIMAPFGTLAVAAHTLGGRGDMVLFMPTMLASLGTMWVVQLPLAFFLPRVTNLGVYGVRWATVASMFLGVVFSIVYFRLGGGSVRGSNTKPSCSTSNERVESHHQV